MFEDVGEDVVAERGRAFERDDERTDFRAKLFEKGSGRIGFGTEMLKEEFEFFGGAGLLLHSAN